MGHTFATGDDRLSLRSALRKQYARMKRFDRSFAWLRLAAFGVRVLLFLVLGGWVLSQEIAEALRRQEYVCPVGAPVTVVNPSKYGGVLEVVTLPSRRVHGHLFSMNDGSHTFEPTAPITQSGDGHVARTRDPKIIPYEGERWSSFVTRAFVATDRFTLGDADEHVAFYACRPYNGT